MPIIEIPDDATVTIRKAAGDFSSDDVVHAILYICGLKMGQDAQLETLRKRLGKRTFEVGLGTRPAYGERTETAKLVEINPMFNDRHQHTAWGADCPVCKQFIHEDIDTEPMPKEERLTACEYCEQKIELLYPWEYFKRAMEVQNAE